MPITPPLAPLPGVTIDKAFITTYDQNVLVAAQQKVSKLRPYVTEKSGVANIRTFPRVGKVEFNNKQRRAPTPVQDPEWANRVAVTRPYDVGMIVEDEEEVRMLTSPKSVYPGLIAAAAHRKWDDIIIAAATADAIDETGTTTPFPTANIIGNGTDEFRFGMATEILKRFALDEIEEDEQKIVVVGPNQTQKMLHMTEATSGEYVYVKALAEKGYVENWLGCKWIRSNRLLRTGGPGTIDCLAFTTGAIGFLVNQDLKNDVAKDPATSFAWRLYAKFDVGAVRIDESRVRVLRVKDAATV